MKRKNFLKSIGLAGAGMIIPTSKSYPILKSPCKPNYCSLIPTETAGPFPLDLTANNHFFRHLIAEDRDGVLLRLKMKIVDHQTCSPMSNVRVNIWHGDKNGDYSGYGDQEGLTFLRGYQMTNSNGEVNFITIFPGWYSGRVCHIHFQVYVSVNYAAISQLTFDHDAVNRLYNDHPTIYTKGEDPKTPDTDGVFSDGYGFQIATLIQNPNTGGYDSFLEVAVQGEGTVGVSNMERETAKYLTLGQNQPNPFLNETMIPYTLKIPSEVKFEIWNTEGKKMSEINKGQLPAGKHELKVNLRSLGLTPANYLYQIEIENNYGKFKTYKLMTQLN